MTGTQGERQNILLPWLLRSMGRLRVELCGRPFYFFSPMVWPQLDLDDDWLCLLLERLMMDGNRLYI